MDKNTPGGGGHDFKMLDEVLKDGGNFVMGFSTPTERVKILSI